MSSQTTHPAARTFSPPADAESALPVRGVLLRSVLLLELDRVGRRTLTVGELCDAIRRHGFTVRGRMGKVISDALRCEIVRGRVRRPARGRYPGVAGSIALGQVGTHTIRRRWFPFADPPLRRRALPSRIGAPCDCRQRTGVG